LGDRNLAGLMIFYTLAFELGLTEQAKPPEFIA
jgi:hypothetical protein